MKYYGKEKCRILKQIRAEIAKNNDIEYVIEECPYQGNCKGTCPKCEQEVRDLEKKLEERKKKGLKIAVAGIAAALPLAVITGCTPEPQPLEGDIPYVESVTEGPNNTETQPESEVKMGEIVIPETSEDSEPVDSETESGGVVTLMGDVPFIPEDSNTEPVTEEDIQGGISAPTE